MNYYNCSVAGESFSRFVTAHNVWHAAEDYAAWCDENAGVVDRRTIIVRFAGVERVVAVTSTLVRKYDSILHPRTP